MSTIDKTQVRVQVRHLLVGDVTMGTNETVLAIQPCYSRTSSKTRNTHRNVYLGGTNGKTRWSEWNASTQVHVLR
jgi:hypothetical protein